MLSTGLVSMRSVQVLGSGHKITPPALLRYRDRDRTAALEILMTRSDDGHFRLDILYPAINLSMGSPKYGNPAGP